MRYNEYLLHFVGPYRYDPTLGVSIQEWFRKLYKLEYHYRDG
jgi:hypothetical protein